MRSVFDWLATALCGSRDEKQLVSGSIAKGDEADDGLREERPPALLKTGSSVVVVDEGDEGAAAEDILAAQPPGWHQTSLRIESRFDSAAAASVIQAHWRGRAQRSKLAQEQEQRAHAARVSARRQSATDSPSFDPKARAEAIKRRKSSTTPVAPPVLSEL